MSAAHAEASSTPVVTPPERPQWLAVSRLLVSEALTNLLWATGVMLAMIAVAALVARWQGLELVVHEEPGMITAQVTADGRSVGIESSLLLFVVVIAVGVTALVNHVVLACRTRVLIAAGATRRSLAIGLLLTAVVMVLYFMAVLTVVTLVVGQDLGGVLSLLDASSAADLARRATRVAGLMAAVMAASTVVVALFMRWPWWVGVGALILLGVVLPAVVGVLWPTVESRVDGVAAGWATGPVSAAVLAGVYWLVARRIPVR